MNKNDSLKLFMTDFIIKLKEILYYAFKIIYLDLDIVVKTFEKSTQKKVPYSIVARRPGDIIQAYADTHKIEKAMGWKAQYSLAEALQSAWKWEVHSAHLEAQ